MDAKDEKILELLKENSKLTTHQIAKKILMPITTVHSRIKKLKKEGIIKKYSIELDHKKLGKSISAYIHIIVDYKSLKETKKMQHDLARNLKQHECVEEVAMVAGGIDIIIKVRVKDVDELDSLVTKYLRNIEGIEKTQTMIVLNEI